MAAHVPQAHRFDKRSSGEHLITLKRRFSSHDDRLPWPSRRKLRGCGRNLLLIYWMGCIAVIVAGVNKAHPEIWPKIQRVLPGPPVDRPFANCAEAHAAGVYNIPIWSPAYRFQQDGDSDGKACEATHRYLGYHAWRYVTWRAKP